MKDGLRKAIFAVPFGCLVALAAHSVRFGDDHAFGGAANEVLVSTAIGGSIAIALVILHVFLTAGTTTTTGTIAAARARQLVPSGRVLFAFSACIYYGIESLEGNGVEVGLPTVVLAALAALLAVALRFIVAHFADFVADIARDWLALLGRRRQIVWHLALAPQPVHSQIACVTRRFGRAPPNGLRFR